MDGGGGGCVGVSNMVMFWAHDLLIIFIAHCLDLSQSPPLRILISSRANCTKVFFLSE